MLMWSGKEADKFFRRFSLAQIKLPRETHHSDHELFVTHRSPNGNPVAMANSVWSMSGTSSVKRLWCLCFSRMQSELRTVPLKKRNTPCPSVVIID
mmetsp:Transcript_28276/g.45580  ORF Transcript_28276/g.45580 Transcript_28276/m.45580 type:complete len:96 (+) Transcript_28276:327-614(+)